jgi:hypothetical protein
VRSRWSFTKNACKQSDSSWVVFLKLTPFVKWNNTEFAHAFCFTSLLLCSTRTWHCMAWQYLPSPPASILSSLYLLNPWTVCLESCLGPLGACCFSGNRNSSELVSLRFWTSDIQEIATSCKNFFYVISCLCLVFCTQKYIEGCRVQQIHSAIWQFSSDVSNNWGTYLPYLCHSWI